MVELNFPRGSTGSSTLNTYEGILALAQNPAFLLQQGFISPEEMLKYVQSAINEPVLRPEDWDIEGYRATVPAGNVTLSGAFDLLDAGMTIGQVMAKTLEDMQAARGGELMSGDIQKVEEIRADVEEYARRLKNANEKTARIANGEWFEDPSGVIYGMGDDARQILASMDLGGIAGIPQMWQPVLDKEMQELARTQLEQAEQKRQSYISGGKKAAKETQTVAQKAYMDFIRQNSPASISGGATNPREIQGKNTSVKTPSRAEIMAGIQASKNVPVPTPSRADAMASINASNGSSPVSANQDYWAKLAASYAGRAAQEASGTQKSAAIDREAAKKLFLDADESARAAIERAQVPALQALLQGPGLAASMAVPAAKASRPAPRVLSDSEIETMANMIAGGMQ